MYYINPLSEKSAKIQKKSEMKRQNNQDNSPEVRKLNWEWYNPSVDSVPVSFCMDTSLHGLKYMGQQKRHIFERIFWFAAFIASVITAIILIRGMWDDYRNMPTITVFNPTVTNLDEVPFPGLTICNVNSLRKSSFDDQIEKIMTNGIIKAGAPMATNLSQEVLADLAKILDMNHICDSTLTFTDRFVGNASILGWLEATGVLIRDHMRDIEQYCDPIATLQNVSQPCSKMILHCVWLEDVANCDELFQEIETDYGHCCTFNSLPLSLLLKQHDERKRKRPTVIKKWKDASLNYENLMFTKKTMNRTVPYRQRYPGRSAGLSILLDPDLDEYFCTNTDSEGFIMGVNVPLDFPRMKDNGIAVQTNSEIFVSLKPEVTMSHDSIKNLPVAQRQCYYGNEYKLRYYTTYTISNCIDECIARKTVERCNCTRYYMPYDDTDMVCKPNMYNCTDYVRKTIVHYGISQSCSECLPTCTQISYQKEVTFLRLQEKKIRDLFKSFPEKIGMKPYTARKVSIVHVYFSKNSMHPKLRKESTTMTQLMSNAGGLLGLCMGFSVLSLLEILYYGSLRLCCTLYRKRRARNHTGERNERNNGKNDIHPKTSKLSHYPKTAWFSQTLDRPSDSENKMDNNQRIFITKGKDEHDYGYYENDSNEFLGGNGNNPLISRSENQSFFLPGSFEDQLHRAFFATAYPEKRFVRVMESN